MDAALRGAGLAVEVRGDEWLLVVFDHTADTPPPAREGAEY
ncbi:hypothetical protein ACFWP3_39255 [Streptomyces sp. NPDC058525]